MKFGKLENLINKSDFIFLKFFSLLFFMCFCWMDNRDCWKEGGDPYCSNNQNYLQSPTLNASWNVVSPLYAMLMRMHFAEINHNNNNLIQFFPLYVISSTSSSIPWFHNFTFIDAWLEFLLSYLYVFVVCCERANEVKYVNEIINQAIARKLKWLWVIFFIYFV